LCLRIAWVVAHAGLLKIGFTDRNAQTGIKENLVTAAIQRLQ